MRGGRRHSWPDRCGHEEIRRGRATNGPWSSNSANKIDWARGGPITFYSGNYLNWKASSTITRTRLEIMQEVLTTLLDNLDDNVNVGLMRYSNDTGNDNDAAAQGGMVVKEMGKIEDNRAAMKTEINGWNAAGWTPLSETLYEATQYYRGDKVYFGGGANATTHPSVFSKSDKFTSNPNGDTPSVTASRNASDKTLYDSPADQDCQKNYLVFLTDGLPTQDNEANARIESLPELRHDKRSRHVRRHRGQRQMHGRSLQVAAGIGPALGPAGRAERHQLLDRLRR